MEDNRTDEQKYSDWVQAVNKLNEKGWRCVYAGQYLFKSPNTGKVYDLSAANLDMLDYIEKTGNFLVDKV